MVESDFEKMPDEIFVVVGWCYSGIQVKYSVLQYEKDRIFKKFIRTKSSDGLQFMSDSMTELYLKLCSYGFDQKTFLRDHFNNLTQVTLLACNTHFYKLEKVIEEMNKNERAKISEQYI